MAYGRPHSKTEQRTFQARPGVVETVMPARITVETLQFAFAELESLGAGPVWFVDTTATEHLESACVRLAATVLPQLKQRGLQKIVAVLASPMMRMAARAAGVASGVDIWVVEKRIDALPLLTRSA